MFDQAKQSRMITNDLFQKWAKKSETHTLLRQ